MKRFYSLNSLDTRNPVFSGAISLFIFFLAVFMPYSPVSGQQSTEDLVKSLPTLTSQQPPAQGNENGLKSSLTIEAIPDSKQAASYMPMPALSKPDQDRTGKELIAEGENLTIGRCIEIALRKNPTIIAATNTVDVNRSRVGETRAAYYPQIAIVGAYDRIKPSTGPSSQFVDGSRQYNKYSGGISLSQTFYDFGRTSSSVNVAKYNLDSSRSDLTTTQDTIILNVKQAYYGVLQTKRNRDVASDVIKQFQLHLDQAKGFYEVGTRARIDVIKAEVDLSNAKLSLITAENAFQLAWVTLNNAMGVPDPPHYTIEDTLFFETSSITLEHATEKAFENRPELKSIVAKRQAAEANISLQRSGYLPILTASAGYNQSALSGTYIASTQPENTWNAGVTITFPLFSGFLTSHQVAEAKSNLYVVKANEESVRQQILLDIRQTYLNLKAAEASVPTAELALQQARENLDIANGRYAAGVGSPIEVSDAFATYITAQASFSNALYNYKTAQAGIERSMGSR
ncbi:MAG: TolC family protein [Nitrospirota bacterium]